MDTPLILLAGPTAVGKTKASISLAKAVNGEIISGDSMQIYRGLDIGTAKITTEEMEGITHHLIDIKDPTEPFNASEFKMLADAAISDIAARGKVPILVGGTGFYINTVLYEYHLGETDTDPEYRKELTALEATEGRKAVWEKLREVDPKSAEKLHYNDLPRVIRALEVYHCTGIPASSRQQNVDKKKMRYNALYLALNMSREILYERINRRVDLMISDGLEEEVKRALDLGVPENAQAMVSIGYREMVDYLKGEISLERAVELIKQNTRHFAKRQLTWFRHDENIHWIDKTDKSEEDVEKEILQAVRERFPKIL